jgi:transcriptional regulator GlxA family with amidase domain
MQVGVLVFTAAEELDLAGPWEMLGMRSLVAAKPSPVLVAQKVEPVRCAKGLTLLPHHGIDDCPPLDVLVVPGGQGTRRAVDDEALIGFIADRAASAKAVLSVCTGAFLLHKAGLLAGRRATTHWASLDRLRALGDVTVVEERYVVDGPIWTSAGVSAGLDMALEFIARTDGPAVAGKVQLVAEYYPDGRRHGGAAAHAQAPDYAHVVPRVR